MKGGLVISAPASSAGKTTLFLGLVKALSRRGIRVQAYKNGPDYIDPAFHTAASGRPSFNLDSWAMSSEWLDQILSKGDDAEVGLVEGSMGLFDGVANTGESGTGATAEMALRTGWPVVLVIDASGQAQTAGAIGLGLASYNPELKVAGVVLNRVASPRHADLARRGVEAAGLKVLGVLPRGLNIELPERHLGLVQACEHETLDAQLSTLADQIEMHVQTDVLLDVARAAGPYPGHEGDKRALLKPPGNHIALAQDEAFSFVYPHILEAWRNQGASITAFSPLSNQAPSPHADVCWLPGGYPELHAGKLTEARVFIDGLRSFAKTKPVHGECGGYMVLGQTLETKNGDVYPMAGLLGLQTSFAKRRMHLGYRRAKLEVPWMGLTRGTELRGHEFHYASILSEPDEPLASVFDANQKTVAETGSIRGLVSGTFFHLNDGAIMTGFVSLVSSGPGDPELLTLKAVDRLRRADVVLYDDLSSGSILDYAEKAELVSVGKRAGRTSPAQHQVSRLLVEYAGRFARVVRLKSGDAGIFGRLEEELHALSSAGISFEIIPGVTSACAAAAAFGLPLTRRFEARRLQFITGTDYSGQVPGDLRWQALTDPEAITVVYMGRRTFSSLAEKLLEHGLPKDTPAYMMESVSGPEQAFNPTTIATLADELRSAPVSKPTLIFYGPLVNFNTAKVG